MITITIHINTADDWAHFRALLQRGDDIMASIQDIKDQLTALTASVAAETTVVRSTRTLLDGLSSIIAGLRDALAEAIAKGSNPADLQAVLDMVTAAKAEQDAQAAELTDALVSHTPAE